jgi:hypothetical protein
MRKSLHRARFDNNGMNDRVVVPALQLIKREQSYGSE